MIRQGVSRAALALFAAGCAEKAGEVDKPDAPDMSALVEAYLSPDGVFNDDLAQDILDAARAVRDLVEALGVDDAILDALETAFDFDAGGGEGEGEGEGIAAIGEMIEGDGYLEVTRICNGWGAEPEPDPENGTIALVVGFTEAGIDPVIWGDAADCEYRLGDARVRIDAGGVEDDWDVRLWVGDSITFESFGESPIIIDVDLAAAIDDVADVADFDFQVDPATGAIEVRVEAGGGFVAVSVAGETWRIRASNGEFDCDPVDETCVPAE